MWNLLEFICFLADAAEYWRFFGCVLAAAVMIILIHLLVPSHAIFLGLSVPIAVVGITVGGVWQWRAK